MPLSIWGRRPAPALWLAVAVDAFILYILLLVAARPVWEGQSARMIFLSFFFFFLAFFVFVALFLFCLYIDLICFVLSLFFVFLFCLYFVLFCREMSADKYCSDGSWW